MVYRVYVEKKPGQTHEATGLLREIQDFLQIEALTAVRVLNRYDAENIEKSLFDYAVNFRNYLHPFPNCFRFDENTKSAAVFSSICLPAAAPEW